MTKYLLRLWDYTLYSTDNDLLESALGEDSDPHIALTLVQHGYSAKKVLDKVLNGTSQQDLEILIPLLNAQKAQVAGLSTHELLKHLFKYGRESYEPIFIQLKSTLTAYNIEEQNKYSETALHYAAELFEPDVSSRLSKVLLELGANPNHADSSGATALMWAAELGKVETVKALLGANADPLKTDYNNKTALQLAQDRTKFLTWLQTVSPAEQTKEVPGSTNNSEAQDTDTTDNKSTQEPLLASKKANAEIIEILTQAEKFAKAARLTPEHGYSEDTDTLTDQIYPSEGE